MREAGHSSVNLDPILLASITLDSILASTSGSAVRVAVLDSGVDSQHPALMGRVHRACVVEGGGSLPVVREISPDDATDIFSSGHGTCVAGIIAQIAPGASLTSVQVLDESNRGSGKEMLAGLEWALENGYKLINLSLSIPSRNFLLLEPLFKLCERAYEQEAIIVASRKNGQRLGMPAKFSSVIAVGEATTTDRHYLRFLEKSLIEFLARGVDVEVAVPGGTTAVRTGTSFAAPHVTGICARILEQFPGIRPYEVKTVLGALARQAADGQPGN